MGHASAIALGIALSKPSKQVFTIDGDGAALMHMGNMATIGTTCKPLNYKHILINNGSHDSVGGQPTRGFDVDFCQIAKGCGYRNVNTVTKAEDIAPAVKALRSSQGPSFLEVRLSSSFFVFAFFLFLFCFLLFPLFFSCCFLLGFMFSCFFLTSSSYVGIYCCPLPCLYLLQIRVNKGARKNLGRPKTTPKENKKQFMDFVDS